MLTNSELKAQLARLGPVRDVTRPGIVFWKNQSLWCCIAPVRSIREYPSRAGCSPQD